jgi:hypothetical protein
MDSKTLQEEKPKDEKVSPIVIGSEQAAAGLRSDDDDDDGDDDDD